MSENNYTCPNHQRTGGYEGCCPCGGWSDGESQRKCDESKNYEDNDAEDINET